MSGLKALLTIDLGRRLSLWPDKVAWNDYGRAVLKRLAQECVDALELPEPWTGNIPIRVGAGYVMDVPVCAGVVRLDLAEYPREIIP